MRGRGMARMERAWSTCVFFYDSVVATGSVWRFLGG